MTILKLRDCFFDCKVLVFDKDGTLIDFDSIWGARIVSATSSMISACQGSDDLRNRLYRTIGYDPEQNQTLDCGPLATARIVQLEAIAATVLHQNGTNWDEAISLTAEHFTKIMIAPPIANEISPRGNLPVLLRTLNDAEIHTAIATTDNRPGTQKCLEILGIENLIKKLLCGDDQTGPHKPDPAVLLYIAESFDTPINQVIMVSDTVSDLKMATAAGAVSVGIAGGAENRADLEKQADVVIDNLEEICADLRYGED